MPLNSSVRVNYKPLQQNMQERKCAIMSLSPYLLSEYKGLSLASRATELNFMHLRLALGLGFEDF